VDHRLKLSLAAAASLAAAGAACAWFLLPSDARPVANAPPAVVEHCKRAAELLYDVHWAAACSRTDDSNDCMLPDAQAAKVNSILAAEENRCMAAEAQASAQQ
jgi:hypothetical protein